jgi:GTP-binding protein YchF
MSFSVGICGLPNVGKSTLFKILTKKEVKISPRPFTTISPNIGKIEVPDERLKKIAEMVRPEKVTPTQIEFIDVAGLIKGAHKGEGLGNQFLAQLRDCDAILEVIRCFEKESVENVLGEINPQKEIEILETELLMKDLETLEKLVKEKKEKREKKDKETEILKKALEEVSKGKKLIEFLNEDFFKKYQFLTGKKFVYLLNINGKTKFEKPKVDFLEINLKEEEEMIGLSEKEKEELGFKSKIEDLIEKCYKTLDLVTFYTIAKGKETRAWTLKKGSSIVEAAEKIHSDFKKFIKAEVLDFETFLKEGGWHKAKTEGKIKIVGRNYKVEDGDIIEFKV